MPVIWLWSNVLCEGCQAWAINQIHVVLEHHNYACSQVIQHVSAIATIFSTELIYVDTQWSNSPVPIVLDVMTVNEFMVNVYPVPVHDSGDISWVGQTTILWPHNITCTSGTPTFVRDLKELNKKHPVAFVAVWLAILLAQLVLLWGWVCTKIPASWSRHPSDFGITVCITHIIPFCLHLDLLLLLLMLLLLLLMECCCCCCC